MTAVTSALSPSRSAQLIKAAVFGGLTGGLLDIVFAITLWTVRGATAERVLQSIASGLMGKAAFQGGWPVAALGLFLHFFISVAAASVYVAASRRLPDLARRPLLWGPLFGAAMFLAMNFIVLPLSQVGPPHFRWSTTPLDIGSHVLLFGPAIALWTRRLAPARDQRAGEMPISA